MARIVGVSQRFLRNRPAGPGADDGGGPNEVGSRSKLWRCDVLADRAGSSPEPPVILVVDDEPDLEQLLCLKFRRRIRNGELTLHFARNGRDALSCISEHPEIELVVTDINMPEMDGLTLVKQLRAQHPTVKAIIVSAYGDLQNIRVAMNCGAYDFLTKPLDFADFEVTVGKTLEHVRTLCATLKSLEENRILKMFVDEAAVHFMLKHERSREAARGCAAERTVAFVDICAFTALSERHAPEVVVELLNTYFEAMVEAVERNGGQVDKFIGDAGMFTFSGPDAPVAAVRACLQAREAILTKRADIERRIGFFPDVSMGINAGQVIMGAIGAHRKERLDFTVVGDVVNLAARLEGAAGPGEILVTREFLGLVADRVIYEDKGLRSLKGKSEPIHLFNIKGLRDDAVGGA